ncbi:MAG TPA: ATP-binding protein [Pyrinomonadaceae bacterium]
MIPVKHQGEVIDTLPGEEVEFTIDPTAFHLIMDSLSDLYSNRSLAVIREYSTNAMDSHIMAGITDPIDVTLPSPDDLHPFFRVTDHGVGLTSTELKELYTSFGKSNKRASKDTNGLLGYGCKSALAYTNSFTVTSVKDGQKVYAVITRKDDGRMVLKEVISRVTDERDGVSVEVPVSNVDEFNRIAYRFYKFWEEGTVTINGGPVENPFINKDNKLGKNLYRNTVDRDSYVVMGNVPYPVNNPASLFPSHDSYVPFVAYVNIGDVEFVPAREALKYTDLTTKTIQTIVDGYITERRNLAEKEVGHAKTKWEALKFSRKWYNLLRVRIPYKGEKIPGELEFEGYEWKTHYRRYPVEQIGKHRHKSHIDLDSDFMVVTGVNSIGSYQKERLKSWALTKYGPTTGRLPNVVYATSDASWNSEWVDPSLVISWDDLKAQTPPPARVARAAGRIKGSWDLFKPDGSRVYGKPLKKAKYWAHLDEIKQWERRGDWHRITAEFGLDNSVVIVPYNRINTFTKAFPNATHIIQHFKTQVDLDGESMYNGEQKEYFGLDVSQRRVLAKYDETKIDDPDFKRLIKISKRTDIVKPDGYDKNLQRASMLGLKFKVLESHTEYTEVEKRYPIIEYGLSGINYGRWARHTEDLYIYINAKYAAIAARKEGNV